MTSKNRTIPTLLLAPAFQTIADAAADTRSRRTSWGVFLRSDSASSVIVTDSMASSGPRATKCFCYNSRR